MCQVPDGSGHVPAQGRYPPWGHAQPQAGACQGTAGWDVEGPNPASSGCQSLAEHLRSLSVGFFLLPVKDQPGCVQAAGGITPAQRWILGYHTWKDGNNYLPVNCTQVIQVKGHHTAVHRDSQSPK